jgi:hypothetical protein
MKIEIEISAPGLEKALTQIAGAISEGLQLTEKQERLWKKAEAAYAEYPDEPSKNGAPKTEKTKTEKALKVADPDESDKITLEMIHALVREKTQDGKMKAIKGALTKQGVAKITELEESQYSEFYKAVKAL